MIFKVNDGMQITIRRAAQVQSGDEITRLSSGTVFEAETVTQTSNTWWVRVLKCDANPAAIGYFGAVMYPNTLGIGKVFATVIEEPPPPPNADEIVKAVIYFGDGSTKELIPK